MSTHMPAIYIDANSTVSVQHLLSKINAPIGHSSRDPSLSPLASRWYPKLTWYFVCGWSRSHYIDTAQPALFPQLVIEAKVTVILGRKQGSDPFHRNFGPVLPVGFILIL